MSTINVLAKSMTAGIPRPFASVSHGFFSSLCRSPGTKTRQTPTTCNATLKSQSGRAVDPLT
jgi:hypothetical protein